MGLVDLFDLVDLVERYDRVVRVRVRCWVVMCLMKHLFHYYFSNVSINMGFGRNCCGRFGVVSVCHIIGPVCSIKRTWCTTFR